MQNAQFTSSELLLKLVLWLSEMSWPQRGGQTTRGSPFDDWGAFSAICKSTEPMLSLAADTPSDVLPASVLSLISHARFILLLNKRGSPHQDTPSPSSRRNLHPRDLQPLWTRWRRGESKKCLCCAPIQLVLPVSSKTCPLITCLHCQECLTG